MAETCCPTSLHLQIPCYWSRAQRAMALRILTLGSNVRIANGSSDPLHPVTELVHCGVIPMRTKILIVPRACTAHSERVPHLQCEVHM